MPDPRDLLGVFEASASYRDFARSTGMAPTATRRQRKRAAPGAARVNGDLMQRAVTLRPAERPVAGSHRCGRRLPVRGEFGGLVERVAHGGQQAFKRIKLAVV